MHMVTKDQKGTSDFDQKGRTPTPASGNNWQRRSPGGGGGVGAAALRRLLQDAAARGREMRVVHGRNERDCGKESSVGVGCATGAGIASHEKEQDNRRIEGRDISYRSLSLPRGLTRAGAPHVEVAQVIA